MGKWIIGFAVVALTVMVIVFWQVGGFNQF